MTPASLYVRKSTDMQENSIESQINVLTAYAKSHDMAIVEMYIDEGISGRSAEKRPAFMRMIEDSANRGFEIVLVYDNSRFARNLEESLVYKSVLRKNGVSLVSITEPTPDGDASLITDAMLGALNEMYSRNLSRVVKRGVAFAAQNGRHLCVPPYGYHSEDKRMLIFEPEAINVRTAFSMCADGKSCYEIAKLFNDSGILKRGGGQWLGRDITRMLKRVTYAGDIYHLGQTYKGLHEPMVKKELWNRVQSMLSFKSSTRTRPSNEYSHWLSGVLYCGCCGQKMTHSKSRTSHYYRCKAYLSGCKNPAMISVPKLTSFLKEALSEFFLSENPTTYATVVRKNSSANEIESLKKTLVSIDKKLERHKAAYSAGVDTLEEYAKNKKQCLEGKKEAEKRLAELTSVSAIKPDVVKIKNSVEELVRFLFYSDASTKDKNISLKSVISKIVVDKKAGEIKVFYFA